MDEIPIEEVSYEDLGLLLSIIHPMNNFPTDETVEKLLELADRFMMPSVTRQVEHHLLNLSKIENKKMMVMADRYKMPSILKKTVREVNSAAKAKQIQSSPEYNNFSDNTKLALFERIFQFL
uniref:BTB domain-containing protein n=1 Tax=Caenorhabditis tropicalis TaxID=1561998 RepID=A0A1I7TGT8_9PELO